MKKVQVALFAASLLVIASASAQAETHAEEQKPAAVEATTDAPVAETPVVEEGVTKAAPDAAEGDDDMGEHAGHEGHDTESEGGEAAVEVE